MNLWWIKRCDCGSLLRKQELLGKVFCPSCNQEWAEVGFSNIEKSKLAGTGMVQMEER